MKIFSIYDKQHDTHGPLFTAVNNELGRRVFLQIKENPESNVAKYPQDYVLVSLGTLDQSTGAIVPQRETIPDAN